MSINSNNTTSLGSMSSIKNESKEISSADFDSIQSNNTGDNNEKNSDKTEDG